MQIKVKVIPKSSFNMVTAELDGSLRVKLTSPPEKGKANKQLVEILANHYKIKKSAVKIIKGLASPQKIVEVKL
jgi:uncharacterized protein (TIGR00251 family)